MGIVLGPNRYGKAQVRVVHVVRDGDRHTLRDLDVRTALAGDLAATHLTGDNSQVLPTDSQKNTVYAFARRHGVASPEAFALLLARHFVHSQPAVRRAEVAVREFGWQRLGQHSFQRGGAETRTATASYDGETARVVSGLTDLVLLNTTNSEFHGFVRDEYTTLPETTDRILATAVDARWRHLDADADWDPAHRQVREALVAAFVETYSRSLQQTLYAMGRRVLEARPEVAEIKLSLPNRHHIPVDLSPFGLDNPNAVFVATDQPYGVIEGTVGRDGVAPADGDW
ncbi:factor-independent urate hydroxylase [Micromonospora haikouensis]|uniref:factor-independent urate hydroxylase n=1 Tax=Micromonospora haikouensis TaxID=686309 RepID=UPI0033CDE0EF